MLQQRLSSQLLKILLKFLKFGGTLNFWVIHFNLLVFVLLLLNVWSYSFLWVRFRFCIYIVQWSGYCGTCIWSGIHIRGNGSQKFGLSLRGNQTLKQFFIFYFWIEDSLTSRGIAFIIFIADYLEFTLVV